MIYYKVRAEFGDVRFAPFHPPPFDELPRGAVVGQVFFRACMNLDCVRNRMDDMLGDFSEGRWFWKLESARPMVEPISARGHQRIWTWEPPQPLTFHPLSLAL